MDTDGHELFNRRDHRDHKDPVFEFFAFFVVKFLGHATGCRLASSLFQHIPAYSNVFSAVRGGASNVFQPIPAYSSLFPGKNFSPRNFSTADERRSATMVRKNPSPVLSPKGARENRRRTTPSKPGALQSKSGEAKSKSVALRRSPSQSKNGAQSIALRGPDFTLQSDALRCLRFAEDRKSPVANQGLAHSSAVWRSQKWGCRV